jgi:phosphorylcholine metabolism protein LicD
VFPIDGIPENIAERDRYIKSKLKLIFKNILYTCKNNAFRPGNKIFNATKYIVKRIMYPSRKQAIIKLDILWKSNLFDSSKYAGVIVDVDALEHCGQVRREVFEKYTTAPFEGMEFKIIEN